MTDISSPTLCASLTKVEASQKSNTDSSLVVPRLKPFTERPTLGCPPVRLSQLGHRDAPSQGRVRWLSFQNRSYQRRSSRQSVASRIRRSTSSDWRMQADSRNGLSWA